MKTRRLTILVTPEERAAVSAKAVALGVTDSEFVRRAVEAYSDVEEREALAVLAREVSLAAGKMRADLEEARSAVRDALEHNRRLRLDRQPRKAA